MKGFRGFVVTLGVVMAMMVFFPGISAFADSHTILRQRLSRLMTNNESLCAARETAYK